MTPNEPESDVHRHFHSTSFLEHGLTSSACPVLAEVVEDRPAVGYQEPPQPILDIIDRPPQPGLSISPDKTKVLPRTMTILKCIYLLHTREVGPSSSISRLSALKLFVS